MNFMWQSSETLEEELLKDSVLETFHKFGKREIGIAIVLCVFSIICLIAFPDGKFACVVGLLISISLFISGFLERQKCKSLTEFEWTQATITKVRFLRLNTSSYKRGRSKYAPSFYVGNYKCDWLSGFDPLKSFYHLDEMDECKAYEGSPVYLVRVPKSSKLYMIPYAVPSPKEEVVSFDDEPITFRGGSGTMKF